MTWPVVARKDVRVLRADNTLALFVAFFALIASAIAYGATNGPAATPLPDILAILYTFAVPLTAGTVTHEAIPRAVASGRIRFALSLPHDRSEYVAGAAAARLAATTTAIAAAAVAAAAVYVARGGPLKPGRTLLVLAASALLAAAFLAATLAFTARSRSTTLSAATSYGFFLLSFLWPAVVGGVRVLLAGELALHVSDATANTVIQLSPVFAYQHLLSFTGTSLGSPSTTLPTWAGGLVLLAWTAAGYALAARRFDSVEL